MSYPVYQLTLHPTYYNKGFFNLGVDVERYVRRDNGPCTIHLGDSGERLEGKVNRNANVNKTPRIHAGADLRNWIYKHFSEMDIVDVVIEAPDILRLKK